MYQIKLNHKKVSQTVVFCSLALMPLKTSKKASASSNGLHLTTQQDYELSEEKSQIEKAELIHEFRIKQIHELLGSQNQRNSFLNTQGLRLDEGHLIPFVMNALPTKFKKDAEAITNQIIKSSLEHKLDPVFLISVIQTESSFNPSAKGTSGEIGLMQLLPKTAAWIAKKNNLKWIGPHQLKDPIKNIQIGATYLSYLRNKFESHARLYISAYNMGPRNVKKALKKSIWPKDYARRIMKNYKEFYSLLNASLYTWNEDKISETRSPASLR
jgi:soluble lytic murein transglycosylase